MSNELLQRVVLLKQKVEQLRVAGVLQKTARAEAILQDAVFIIEQLVIANSEAKKDG